MTPKLPAGAETAVERASALLTEHFHEVLIVGVYHHGRREGDALTEEESEQMVYTFEAPIVRGALRGGSNPGEVSGFITDVLFDDTWVSRMASLAGNFDITLTHASRKGPEMIPELPSLPEDPNDEEDEDHEFDLP